MTALLALEGQWHGWAAAGVLLTAITVFMGTIFVLLTGILGPRKAYLVQATALSGFVIILSLMWLAGAPGTVPGTGPRGTEPTWIPFIADSEQGHEFTRELDTFPQDWDKAGKQYAGGIDSGGEIDNVRGILTAALATRAKAQGLQATDPADWNFLAEGRKPSSPDEEALPVATVRFLQRGTPLLFGITIPGTAKHPAVTVFAFRDKGQIFKPSAMFLGVSVVMFALHLALLAREDERDKRLERASATSPGEPARV